MTYALGLGLGYDPNTNREPLVLYNARLEERVNDYYTSIRKGFHDIEKAIKPQFFKNNCA